MALTDGNGLSAADIAAVTGANNGFGFGGDGAWWIIILFLFAFMGNGWGNGYGNGGGYSNRRSYGHMPDPYYGYEESMGRMRSPVTGRYISGGMNGYSGHSIEDRMIMALEQQMDSAKTDYERQMVEKEIQRIRRGDK